jgi:nucleoside-diphosphate-sugar epimerase
MELAGKVALVTGATGLVGSRITQCLLQEGMRVCALDRVPRPVEVAGVEAAVGDIPIPAVARRRAVTDQARGRVLAWTLQRGEGGTGVGL